MIRFVLPLLAGCRSLLGFEEPETKDALDAPTDSMIDAAVCTTPTTTCYENAGTTSMVACSLTPPGCDSRLFRYCDCGAGIVTGGVMVFPGSNPSSETTVVYSSLAGLGNLSLSVADIDNGNFFCLGATGTQCAIDEGVCESGNNTTTQWVAPRGPGKFKVIVYSDETGAPCNVMDTLTSVIVTR